MGNMLSYMFYGGSDGHVTVQDVVDASRNLKTLTSGDFLPRAQFESLPEAVGNVNDVGINFNKWRRPVKMFGPGDGDLQRQISQNDHVKDFDVDPSDWKRSCETVNVILEGILF